VAVWAIAAESDEQAQYLASSSRMAMRMLRQGQLIAVPPPEKAIKYLRSIGQPTDHGFTDGRRGVLGSPAKVAAELHAVGDAYGADEVIVVTITYDHEARKRSYELIAEAVGLEPREPGQPGEPRQPGQPGEPAEAVSSLTL
jgi:alkanesulfonate monooxygenase SsuD/methylene tetrahydromethanopterin reductase-like flavin-dependent oxidoreductase (luciferase family)